MASEQTVNGIAPAALDEDLPESLADVALIIGLEATLKLSERFGGIRISIPRPDYLTEDHPLARTVGLEAARKLAKLCVGQRLSVPRAVKAIRRARDRALRRDYVSMSASQCARKYRMTERRVYSIVARTPEHQQENTNSRKPKY